MSFMTQKEIFGLLPQRAKESSKHDYGKVLAICGSSFYRGAAFLCTRAALRCGAGIVTLASTEKVISAVAPSCPECTFLPLEESENGTISAKNCKKLLKNADNYTALLIGCGLYIDSHTKTLVKTVVPEATAQLVIDADGINILSECPDLLKKTKAPAIITPHFGEMSRLCKKDRTLIESNPLGVAQSFAKDHNCIVVLKSHVTYIASPDGRIAINGETGNAGLARGGSGDLLAGMIASFCAQGLSPFDAAKCGVFLHGLCADKCAQRLSVQGMLPGDILTDMASIFEEI